jgi:hypothetical protein
MSFWLLVYKKQNKNYPAWIEVFHLLEAVLLKNQSIQTDLITALCCSQSCGHRWRTSAVKSTCISSGCLSIRPGSRRRNHVQGKSAGSTHASLWWLPFGGDVAIHPGEPEFYGMPVVTPSSVGYRWRLWQPWVLSRGEVRSCSLSAEGIHPGLHNLIVITEAVFKAGAGWRQVCDPKFMPGSQGCHSRRGQNEDSR